MKKKAGLIPISLDTMAAAVIALAALFILLVCGIWTVWVLIA